MRFILEVLRYVFLAQTHWYACLMFWMLKKWFKWLFCLYLMGSSPWLPVLWLCNSVKSIFVWPTTTELNKSQIMWIFYWAHIQTSNIRHAKSQNLNVSHLILQLSLPVKNEDVVGAASTGYAPTTYECSTILLPPKVRLIWEVWRYCTALLHDVFAEPPGPWFIMNMSSYQYSVPLIYHSLFCLNNSQGTPIALTLGWGMGVFREIIVWSKFYLQIECTVCGIMSCGSAIYLKCL